jgi:hypothetical protein
MGWFATSLATTFLNCNDHLQLISTQHIPKGVSGIEQVAWVATNATHHMWNHIHM